MTTKLKAREILSAMITYESEVDQDLAERL